MSYILTCENLVPNLLSNSTIYNTLLNKPNETIIKEISAGGTCKFVCLC